LFGFSQCWRQVCRQNHIGGNLTNPVQCLAEYGRFNHMNPWVVSAGPADHSLSQILLCQIIDIPGRRRDDGPKAIGREKGFRFVIVESDGRRVVEQGRSDGGERSIAGADTVSRIQPVNPIHRYRPRGAHPQHCQTVRQQPRFRRRFKYLLNAAGMIRIIVGDPNSPQVLRIND